MKVFFSNAALNPSGAVGRIIATAKGISRSDAAMIMSELEEHLQLDNRSINFEGCSCAALFDEYRRTLSL